MSVVIAGSVALDNVKTPQDEQKNLLGGSASYAALAASVFVKPVHLVGIIGHDFPPQHLDMLASHGVDASAASSAAAVPPSPGPANTTRT
jgi:sugar/nucleoside kinase (ribokinase family)